MSAKEAKNVKSEEVAEQPVTGLIKVTAVGKVKNDKGEVTGENTGEIEYNFGASLKEAVELYGEDAVYNNYRQAAVIALQGNMRRHLGAGKTGDALAEAVKDWKPGLVSRSKKSASEKVLDLFKGKTPEEIAAILKEAGLSE